MTTLRRFNLRIEDVFFLEGQGLVMAGRVLEGRIEVGDRVVVRTPTEEMTSEVMGLEVNREILPTATQGQDVALLFRELSPARLPGGLERTDRGSWLVKDLSVTEAPAPWWAFWR